MNFLVSQHKQICNGQREAFQDSLTSQHIVHTVLLHIGDGAEHENCTVFWIDNPHPTDADSEILSQYLPYVLPAVVGGHDFDHQVWSNLEKTFGRTFWPALLGQKHDVYSPHTVRIAPSI